MVRVGVRVSVMCREFIIMINSKFAGIYHNDKFGRVLKEFTHIVNSKVELMLTKTWLFNYLR